MAAFRTCLLILCLTALSIYGLPTTAVPDRAGHQVPHEPRGNVPVHPSAAQPPMPPQPLPPHQVKPPHAAAEDRAANPHLPRDTVVSSTPCTDDSNCTTSTMGENSECHGNMCQCKVGATLSSQSGRCLKESKLGSGCVEDWQCTKPLGKTVSCQSNYCTCVKGAIVINGKCWMQKLIGDQCSSAEECLKGQNAECVDNSCNCKSEMVPAGSRDKCLPKAEKPSDPCEEDIQCTESFGSGGACVNGKCICQDGYHFKNHFCMKNLKIDEACGSGINGDCFLIHDQGINHVECAGNKCKCKDDRIPSSDGERCLSPDQNDPGSGGGADSVQPLLLTLLTILLARFLIS